MIEYIISISVTIVAVLITIWYFFFNKKKPDVIASSETKILLTGTKQSNSKSQKEKKKNTKKSNQNESETRNSFDDLPADNNRNENINLLGNSEAYEANEEIVVPLKISEESTAPERTVSDKKKRKSKAKHLSGDQVSTETKTSDVEKNENQSNTILGRNNDDKLQEEIKKLQNKLVEINNERKKTESEMQDIKTSMQLKECENEKLKSELISEKERIDQILLENEHNKTNLQQEKTQKMHDNEGHTAMYRKYEDKIELLNSQIKSHQTELSNLNQKLKVEMDNAVVNNKRYNEINSTLKEKLEEIKTKDSNANKFQEMNNTLRKTVEDIQRQLANKNDEITRTRNDLESQNNKLKNVIERLERENKNKASEVSNVKKNEVILLEEVSELKRRIDVLNVKMSDSEHELSKKHRELVDNKCKMETTICDLEKQLGFSESASAFKVKEMDENNTRLQVAIHQLEKEIGGFKRTIIELEEANTRQIEKSSHEVEHVINSCAARNEEINKRSSESIAQQQENIRSLEEELKNSRDRIDELEDANKTLTETFKHEAEDVINSYTIKEEEIHRQARESINQLQETIHSLEKELENSRDIIVKLEDANKRLTEISSREADNTFNSYAIREDEIKRRSSESITELGKLIYAKDQEIVSYKNKLEEFTNENGLIKKLEHDLRDRVQEISDLKKDESFLREELTTLQKNIDNLQSNSIEHGDMKYEEVISKNSQLEAEICNLKKQCQESDRELEVLDRANTSLFDNLSSANIEIKELKERVFIKEEENVYRTCDTNPSHEIEKLSKELINKEHQVEDLVHTTSALEHEKEKLEQILSSRTEELNKKIMELSDEIIVLRNNSSRNIIHEEMHLTTSVPLNSVCDSDLSSNKNEVDNLKSHISKLEKELKGMQGRYYNLKEDSMKVPESHRHSNQINKSETNVISIPPNDSDNCSITTNDIDSARTNATHDSLQEAINRLNLEIDEQRLTNQKLSGHLKSKENEVNVLKQCLLGLDGSLNKIGNMANDLQKSCLVTQTEKNSMKCQHETLVKDHESLRQRYLELEKNLSGLNEAIHTVNHQPDNELLDEMKILYEENQSLRVQLEQYRDSLEKTEQMLEKIQSSVDKEEGDWTAALRSSEQECTRLEMRVKELTTEIEELKSENVTDASNMIASVTSVDNGTVTSESKKKRKRKNKKKKKNKNRPIESNGI